jgi:hypothetical protein
MEWTVDRESNLNVIDGPLSPAFDIGCASTSSTGDPTGASLIHINLSSPDPGQTTEEKQEVGLRPYFDDDVVWWWWGDDCGENDENEMKIISVAVTAVVGTESDRDRS